MVKGNDVVLFMKGTKDQPQCGFSSTAVALLDHYNVQFEAVDVLKSDLLRQNIKKYSNWPTIPQLFVKGEFVGGCDIMVEEHEKGTLKKILAAG
jgi:monothiol glutaredoxin